MAIQFVGSQTALLAVGDSTINFSLTGGIGSVPIENDLVIVSLGVSLTSDIALGVVTSGYTEVAELYANSTRDTNLSVSGKRMGATPDTTVVVSGKTVSSAAGTAVIHVYRGVDTSQALDVTSTTSTVITSIKPNPAAITPITDGALIVVASSTGSSNISGTMTAPYLSDFTLDTDTATFAKVYNSIGNVAWTSGSYDPAEFTFSGTDSASYTSAAVTMALRPAVTGSAELTATDITTASPTLDASTLVATSILEATGITTEAVSIAVATLSQTHTLTSTTIDIGVPTLDTAILVAIAGLNELTANGIVTGVPELVASTIGQEHTLTATNVTTEAVTVGNTTLQVTSVLVAVNVDTEAPTLGTPSAAAFSSLVSEGITTASASVATTEIGQLHVLLSVSITTAPPVVSSTVAYSQAAFSEDYERKRTVWVLSENRVVVVSKDDTPTVVTAERENRITTI